MANVMSIEKRNTILRPLVEGNSIRLDLPADGNEHSHGSASARWGGKHCAALAVDRLQGR